VRRAAVARSGLGKGERVVEGELEEQGSGDRSGFGRGGLSPLSPSLSLEREGAREDEQKRQE